LTNIFIATFSL